MKFSILATVVTLGLIAKCFAKTSQNTSTFFNNLQAAISFTDKTSYPNNTFNANCMRASCPGLSRSGLCPYDSDGNFNCTTINRTMSILNECIANKTLICNTPFDPIPFHTFSYSLDQLLNKTHFDITCYVNPNATETKLSKSVYSVAKDKCVSDGCLQLTVTSPNLTYNGSGHCEVRQKNTNISFQLPSIKYSMFMPTVINSRLNCNKQNSSVQLGNINTAPDINLGNLVVNMQPSIIAELRNFIQNSQLPKAMSWFLSNLADSAIEATKQSCSKNG